MLFIKMIRDIKNHKVQFISIFIMAFFGVFIYSGIGGEYIGLKDSSNKYYSKTNMADVWIYGSGFNKVSENELLKCKDITETERRLVLNSVGNMENNPTIKLNFIEKNKISKSHLVSGEKFDVDKKGIWIDDRFASERNLKVGDSIELSFNGVKIKEKIKGTIYSPECVYISDGGGMKTDFSQLGYAYISYKEFPIPNMLMYNEILVKVNQKLDKKEIDKLEEKIDKALDGKYSVYITRDNHESYSMFSQEIEQHKSMGSVFPIAFLCIALLTIITTMTRLVNNQRTQIGVLKALGFKKYKIIIHYISYVFFVSFAGAILGVILGPKTLPLIFYPPMSKFYTMPEWSASWDYSFYIMAILTVILSILITYIACTKVLVDTPADTLRPKGPKNMKSSKFEDTKIWNLIGFNGQWNYRDATRNKARSLMNVLGVCGCTALMVCALNLNQDMNDVKVWKYQDMNKYEAEIHLDEKIKQSEINNIIKKTNGQCIMQSPIEIKANGNKKTGSININDDVTLIKNTDKNRNYIELPKDGISISYKIAKLLSVKKGDTIKWHIFGDEKWVESNIKAIYRDPSTQGITISRDSFEKLDYSFKPTLIITKQKKVKEYKGVKNILYKKDIIAGWDEMVEAMMIMVYLLIAGAVILAVVVLYNLGILSIAEKERDMATLKVIGFKTKKLRSLLLIQNLVLSLVGFLIGVPLGKALVKLIVKTTGASFDLIVRLHASDLAVSVLVVVILCLVVNKSFTKKIKSIDMVSALKGVE